MSWRVWRVGVAVPLSLFLSACASMRGRPVDEAEAYLRAPPQQGTHPSHASSRRAEVTRKAEELGALLARYE